MRSSMLSGRSIGLKDNVCGQIGVIRIAGISGWTREPPAESCEEITVSLVVDGDNPFHTLNRQLTQ